MFQELIGSAVKISATIVVDGGGAADSATINIYHQDGTQVTSIFFSAPSVSGQNVNVSFKYPNEGENRYYLRFIVTITGGKVVERTFNRVFAEDTSDGR